MSIAYHISDLLHTNDCVIVPDFGGFILNRQSSKHYKDQNIIKPPHKSVTFNRNIKLNDGLLTNRLMSKYGIAYDEANQRITNYSKKLTLDLLNNKLVFIPGIGKFYYDIENHLQFVPVSDTNYQLDSFGLKAIELRKIEKQKDSKPKIIHLNNEELNEMDLKKATLLQYAAILILVFSLAFQHNIFNLGVDDFKSVQVSDLSESINNIVDGEKEIDPLIKNKKEIETINKQLGEEVESLRKSLDELKEAINSDSALKERFYPEDSARVKEPKEIIKEQPLVIKSPKISGNKPLVINASNFNDIYIIVSAFRKLSKAEETASNLKEKNYNVNILETETGWYRVAISNFAGFKQAQATLDKMKQQVNKGSWILNK